MTAVRIAKAEDKKAFYDLWKICFGDSNCLLRIGFSLNRFAPDYSVVLETEAKLSAVCRRFRIRFGYAEGKFRERCSVVFLPIRIIEKRATWGRFSPMK